MFLRALIVVFCFFSATGSFPVTAFDIKVSNVYTLLFCVLIPFFLARPRGRENDRAGALEVIAAFFCLWQFLSALWAPGIDFSLYRALVVSGYVFLAFGLPLAAHRNRIDLIDTYARVGVGASVLLIVCYIEFQPLGARGVYPQLFIPAMTMERLLDYDLNDPNILACALSIAFITVTMRFQGRWLYPAAVVCVIAIMLTQSRTALAFLPLTAFFAAMATGNHRALKGSIVSLFVLVLAGFALYSALGDLDALMQVSDALQGRFASDSASNDDRIERLENAFSALRQPEVFLFGLGAGGSISSGLEPHNMFLSFFLELGILGFAMFTGIFLLFSRMAFQVKDQRERFFIVWILLFVFFACLTYWHTRTLWFSLSLVLFGWQQSNAGPRRRTSDAPPHSWSENPARDHA